MFEHQRTTTVIHLAINAADAQTLPVLVMLDDAEHPVISMSVARFARYFQREGTRSYESISKAVSAIAKLRDFYVQSMAGESLRPGELKALLEDFLFAYDHGTLLGWHPASNQQYRNARAAVHDYVRFLLAEPNASWSNEFEQRFIEACRVSWTSTTHAEKSLLFHTKRRPRKKTAGRKKVTIGLKHFKPFPPELVQDLIDTTKNPRDKLAFALLAYGGRRESELLHLFATDIAARGAELAVHLRHPARAPMTWKNHASKIVSGERREYLKSIFGLLPRTEHGANPSAVGWKGIKFDDESELRSELYWIGDRGSYLLDLHRTYLHSVRAMVPRRHHPYYFVSEDGEPLKVSAFENQFRLACRRLERKHGISLRGFGPHSLRHFYGFYCVDVLNLDLLLVQKFLGHADPSSTAIYAHISLATASAALAAAEQFAKASKNIQIPAEEREDIKRSFLEAQSKATRLGTTTFGTLDSKTLTRRLQ